MNDLLQELSKTKRLEYELLQEIKIKYIKPHTLFYSEREIIEKYELNRTTVRQALKALTDKGFLYRINGKGTFTAPKAKLKQILIVQKIRDNPFETGSYAQIEFNNGISRIIQQDDLPYIAIQIDSKYFLEILGEINLIYKNLSGVIFYSDISPLEESKKKLEKMNLPYMFYGSNKSLMTISSNYLVYDQKEIVKHALDYLYEQGHRGIGFVYTSDSAIRIQRKDEYLNWMVDKGIDIGENFIIDLSFHFGQEREVKYTEIQNQLKPLLPIDNLTAVLCADDLIALYFINSTIRLNYSIPEDISVIGINNYPFSPDIITPLTTVSIPFYESGKDCIKIFDEYLTKGKKCSKTVPIEIIERESVIRTIKQESV